MDFCYRHMPICIYNLQSCYETSRQNKKEENLDIIKVLILLRLLLSFVWSQTLASVWHSLLAFFFSLMCWYKSQSFVFVHDDPFLLFSKQFCYFDNFNSLPWGYYLFGFWLLLALEITIRIIIRGGMVGIKLERGGGWKNFCKINVVNMLNNMKDFCCLDLKYTIVFLHQIFIEYIWIYMRPFMA